MVKKHNLDTEANQYLIYYFSSATSAVKISGRKAEAGQKVTN